MLNNIYVKPTQEGWPEFKMKSPVKVKILQGTNIDKFNELLENDIRDAGDRLQHKTAAKCHMTRWDMDQQYGSFKKLGELVPVMRVAKAHKDGTVKIRMAFNFKAKETGIEDAVIETPEVGDAPIFFQSYPAICGFTCSVG